MARTEIWMMKEPTGAWGLRMEPASKAFAVFDSRPEALLKARALAKEARCALSVLDAQGEIESRESF